MGHDREMNVITCCAECSMKMFNNQSLTVKFYNMNVSDPKYLCHTIIRLASLPYPSANDILTITTEERKLK